ncbi:MAG: F0F1 ATP synthase subunit B' [Proteobacteria bacterium]|nr:F0F1 ATP synthase subunit B' [Pseudomonadota bacterium]
MHVISIGIWGRSAIAGAIGGLTVAALPALAEGASGGMPQFNPSGFAPQLFWLVITFVTLYFVMARVALPRIAEVLELRAERISDDLDKAAALKAEADQVIAVYEKALAEARAQAANVGRETAASHAAAAATRQAQLGTELGAKIKAAEARIAAARATAMASLTSVAGVAAQAATKRLIGVDIEAAEAERAAATALRERG